MGSLLPKNRHSDHIAHPWRGRYPPLMCMYGWKASIFNNYPLLVKWKLFNDASFHHATPTISESDEHCSNQDQILIRHFARNHSRLITLNTFLKYRGWHNLRIVIQPMNSNHHDLSSLRSCWTSTIKRKNETNELDDRIIEGPSNAPQRGKKNQCCVLTTITTAIIIIITALYDYESN